MKYKLLLKKVIERYHKINRELRRISKIKRHNKFSTDLLGHFFEATDSASFVAQYKEIFLRKIYQFNAVNDHPFIIDCGANVGTSVFFFKLVYPKSEILAFEPDEDNYHTIKSNIERNNLSNIRLLNNGVWKFDGVVKFNSNKDDSGRIIKDDEDLQNYEIEVVSLKKFINKRVDLLKIDIEGAEHDVLVDISNLLNYVERLFIEYHSFSNETQRLDEILRILTKAGFRYYLESTSIFSKNPFIDINITNNSIDNLINIFAYKSK